MILFPTWRTIGTVQKKYVAAGAEVGDAVSYGYLGECVGFARLFARWVGWEQEYARRGFRTVSLDRFIELGGYGKSIDDVLGVKRASDEAPIFHAKIYREVYLGKLPPAVELDKLMNGPFQGTYILPSTEKKDS